MKQRLKVLSLIATLVSLSACATPGFRPEMKLADATLNPETVTEHTLKWLPGPTSRIPIAVYGVADQTGSFKPSDGGQNLSRAVTQAPTPILIKALQDAGNRRWFSVIERENLQNILRERQIILDMRKRYLGETELNREALPALKFAGVLIEGAITGYDTNTVTGGAGARYLGIGGSTQYREDAVSVYLRAVSVKTGEVLISISSEQRVASVAAQGNAFRFVAFQELLEAEAGLTMNQPRHLAVRQAFEKAVYGMIVEGSELGLWSFGDAQAGQAAVSHYRSTYARAPQDKFEGVLPDAFYAARQRDIERIEIAAAENRRQTALLQQQENARLASAARAQRAQAQVAQAQATQAQAAQSQAAQSQAVQSQAPRVAQAQTVRAPQIAQAQSIAPQSQTAPQSPAPTVESAEAQSVVVAATLAPAPVRARKVVLQTSGQNNGRQSNQTVLDAYQAVEVSLQNSEIEVSASTAAVVLSEEAIRNLLNTQQRDTSPVTILSADASQASGGLHISEHKEAAPPP